MQKNNSKSLRFLAEGLPLQQSQTLCYKKQQQTGEAAKELAMKHISTPINQKWDSEDWSQGRTKCLQLECGRSGDFCEKELWELCWDIRANLNVKDETEKSHSIRSAERASELSKTRNNSWENS